MLARFRDERNATSEEYGAPLRLRVENQLGYKMVKWIERIEFVESEKQVGKGEGGTNEDDGILLRCNFWRGLSALHLSLAQWL